MKKINLVLIVMLVTTMFAPAINVWAEEVTLNLETETQIQTETQLEVELVPEEIQPEVELSTNEITLEEPIVTEIEIEPQIEISNEIQISATPVIVVPPTIDIRYPTGGETFTLGSNFNPQVTINSTKTGTACISVVQEATTESLNEDGTLSCLNDPTSSNGQINIIQVYPNISPENFVLPGHYYLKVTWKSTDETEDFTAFTPSVFRVFPSSQPKYISLLTNFSALDQITGAQSTNDTTPGFYGTFTPNTKVQIYEKFDHEVIKDGVSTFTAIYGSTTSDEDGKWQIEAPFNTTTGALTPGEYVFVACEVINDMCVNPTLDFKLTIQSTDEYYMNFKINGSTMPSPVDYKSIMDVTWESNLKFCNFYGNFVHNTDGVELTTGQKVTSGSEKVIAGLYLWETTTPTYTDTLMIAMQCGDYEKGISLTKEIYVSIKPLVSITEMSQDTGISDTDFITKDNTPSFSGTTYPNTEVQVFVVPMMVPCITTTPGLPCGITSTLIGTTTSDEFGNWTVENATNSLPDGVYQIYAEANIDENYSQSPDITVIIDTQAPKLEYTYFHNGATADVNFEFMTYEKASDGNIVIVSHAIDDNLLESEIIFWDMHQDTSNITDYRTIGYSKKFDIYEPIHFDLSELNLKDSSYRVMIISKDKAGNEIIFGDKTFVFVIDSIAPDAPIITSPTSGPYTGSSTLAVSGTCDIESDHLNFTYEILGGTEPDSILNKIGSNFTQDTPCRLEGTFTTTIPLVSEGEAFIPFKFGVVQIDKFGNMSAVSNIITISKQESSGGGGGGGGGGGDPTPKCTILGDINCDGKVNKYDFALMMVPWGLKVTNEKADLTVDGLVNKYDFALLMSNWGYGEVKR